MGNSTDIVAMQDFVNGLKELRANTKFLKLREVNSSIALFADLTNLPKVVGAINGSHVIIRAPTASDSAPDYFGPYQKHDYITQLKLMTRIIMWTSHMEFLEACTTLAY